MTEGKKRKYYTASTVARNKRYEEKAGLSVMTIRIKNEDKSAFIDEREASGRTSTELFSKMIALLKENQGESE